MNEKPFSWSISNAWFLVCCKTL